jgi:hypothetical protein
MPGDDLAVFRIDPKAERLTSAGAPIERPGPSRILLLP